MNCRQWLGRAVWFVTANNCQIDHRCGLAVSVIRRTNCVRNAAPVFGSFVSSSRLSDVAVVSATGGQIGRSTGTGPAALRCLWVVKRREESHIGRSNAVHVFVSIKSQPTRRDLLPSGTGSEYHLKKENVWITDGPEREVEGVVDNEHEEGGVCGAHLSTSTSTVTLASWSAGQLVSTVSPPATPHSSSLIYGDYSQSDCLLYSGGHYSPHVHI